MAFKSRRFAPRLEAFDDRCLPSVSYSEAANMLFVNTGPEANEIVITDNGTDLVVTVDGEALPVTGDITQVYVDAGAGNDTVVYNLTGTLTESRLIDVRQGRGADSFTANLDGQGVADWTSLIISAYGGGGGDSFALNAEGVSTAENSVLNVYFSGDAGKDTMTFNYLPSIELGSVSLEKDQRR